VTTSFRCIDFSRSLLWWVFLSICLFAHITGKPHGGASPISRACCLWLWLGPLLTALRYVICTSGFVNHVCFHIMALQLVIYIPKRRYNTTRITAEIPTEYHSTTKTGSKLSLLIVSSDGGAVYHLRLPCIVCQRILWRCQYLTVFSAQYANLSTVLQSSFVGQRHTVTVKCKNVPPERTGLSPQSVLSTYWKQVLLAIWQLQFLAKWLALGW